ncbi:MAG TPA: zinc ribbon domain-containing protein [Dehalococcoidia bacterium]|nr:zinc ribbon domain-containing protein [Dehalococcoidia bacterium]
MQPKRRGFILIWLLGGLALGLSLGGPASAREPDAPALRNTVVHVLPEYEQPRVMVTVQGEVVGASFPLTMRFRLPPDAEVGHACTLPPGDQHTCHPFRVETQGDERILTYEVPIQTFFIEYYYSPFNVPGQRDLRFVFRPLYPVEGLSLAVQEPRRAIGFGLLPESASITSDGEGFRNYNYRYDRLAVDEPLELSIAYSKQDLRPSVNPAAQSGGSDRRRPLMILVAAGGAVMALLVYRLAGRRLLTAAAGPRPTGRFCTRCGMALDRGFRFCAGCGASQGHRGAGP